MDEKEKYSININKLNEIPLNKKAFEGLNQINVETESDSVYMIQLGKWGFTCGGIEVDEAVVETIEAMLNWKPERIINFFMIDPDNMEYNPRGWREAEKPLDLARVIIDDIEAKMHTHFPMYGCTE